MIARGGLSSGRKPVSQKTEMTADVPRGIISAKWYASHLLPGWGLDRIVVKGSMRKTSPALVTVLARGRPGADRRASKIVGT